MAHIVEKVRERKIRKEGKAHACILISLLSSAQKIKSDLIQKAQVKKSYAKIKARELAAAQNMKPSSYIERDVYNNDNNKDGDTSTTTSFDLHPDRQAMLNHPPTNDQDERGRRRPNGRKPKRSAFSKEMEIAEKRKQEADVRKKEKELKQKDREAMLRARRPAPDGKRRLGRESKVLLSRVQRMVEGQ